MFEIEYVFIWMSYYLVYNDENNVFWRMIFSDTGYRNRDCLTVPATKNLSS